MLINDIHTFVKFLKNQGQNKYHSPEEIDAAINRASLDLFRQEEKIFEEEQIITDTLRPFKVRKSNYAAGGLYDLPSDYIRATNISHLYTNTNTVAVEDASTFCDNTLNVSEADSVESSPFEKEIDLISDGDWVKRQDNLVVGPTTKNPIARIFGNQFQVSPSTITPILYYLKKPTRSVWAYTISGDGRSFIFDEDNSVDLEWSEISHNEIIEKTISLLGFSVREGAMMQFEQMQKKNNKEQ